LSTVDCIVIGAGVIGLAVARALARGGREVVIIESERHIGMHASSRNSEVIHAGLHYPPHSLKARLCVSGAEQLYRYCVARGIEHRRCGKFTVATDDAQIGELEKIAANAQECGATDLKWLDGEQARRAEPQLACSAALFSPSTGIIDSQGYLNSLLADAQLSGASIVFASTVNSLRPCAQGIDVFIGADKDPSARAGIVVNCAGLNAQRVAGSISRFPAAQIPPVYLAKGSYFTLTGRSPFSHLVYPAPTTGGHLGIHMTLDLAGAARFGPDMEWVNQIDYAIDIKRAAVFIDAIRQYWPGVEGTRLQPAYTGIRPKLSGPGEAARDFCIQGPSDHGFGGIVNLFGMDSPGLTASLAIGEYVAAMLS
jgi:L-2-hydroxyglutarate oxidase LhgO